MKVRWIEIDCRMVAVDKATGEILNDSLDTLPLDYDVSQCVSEVLDGLFGQPLYTTSQIKTETRGRKAKEVSNPYASFFSSVQYNEDTGTSNMVDALDDLVYSASTVSTGNTRIPVKQLVHVMRNEDLSSKAIQNTLRKRRIIKGDDAPGIRYCQQILESAEHLIKRIEAHQERGTINLNDSSAFQFEEDSVAYERSQGVINAKLCPVEFTMGDRQVIRTLAKAGNVQAINDYIKRVTEQSGRMMQRILDNPAYKDAGQVYKDLDAEFPYEPYGEDAAYVTRNKERDSWMFEIEACAV